MNSEPAERQAQTGEAAEISRRLSETYATAALFWPAPILAVEAGAGDWPLLIEILLWGWSALFALAVAFGRGKDRMQYGFCLWFGAGACLAGWTLATGAWVYGAGAIAIVSFHAAQRLRLLEPPDPKPDPKRDPKSGPSAG
ncbi:MAG: hypothetical protein AAFQ88_01685 [Pseudomonadota bacterium]